jgi:hypothetical protein
MTTGGRNLAQPGDAPMPDIVAVPGHSPVAIPARSGPVFVTS